jgi:hypothetical protein
MNEGREESHRPAPIGSDSYIIENKEKVFAQVQLYFNSDYYEKDNLKPFN